MSKLLTGSIYIGGNLSFKPIYLSQHGFGITSKMVKSSRLYINIKYKPQVHLIRGQHEALNQWRLELISAYLLMGETKRKFKNVLFCGIPTEMNDSYHSEPLGGELDHLFWLLGVAVLTVGQSARIPARGRWHCVPSMPKLKFLNFRKHRWNLRTFSSLASSENCSLVALCWMNRCRVTNSRCARLAKKNFLNPAGFNFSACSSSFKKYLRGQSQRCSLFFPLFPFFFRTRW